MRPVRFARITNPFAAPGSYMSRADEHGPAGHHTGIDFGKQLAPVLREIAGLPVRSSTPGTVVIREWNATMGNWVGIYYAADDVLLTYWHLDRIHPEVEMGDWVPQGAVLGWVGSTGNSTAPHLHVQANRGREFDYHGHIAPGPWVRGMDQWWPRFLRERVAARRAKRKAARKRK